MSADPAAPPPPPSARIRLQKVLASCGLGSRRACEELISAGRVTIDGQVASQLGTTVDPSQQEIALDGEPLTIERKKYFLLNKPAGIVCTNRDPSGRPRVIDLFPPNYPRLFTVGRLDEASEGLLIVTNDGDLAQKLAHPKFRIYRTYHIQVAGVPTRDILDSMREGMYFAEGKFRVHSAKLLRKIGQSSQLEVILAEGHNREIRRLFARVNHKVMKLTRVAFGPIRLGKTPRGAHRELTHAELSTLHGLVHRNVTDGPPPKRPRPKKKEVTKRPSSMSSRPPSVPSRPQSVKRPRVVRERDEDFDDDDDQPAVHPALGGRRPAVGAGAAGEGRKPVGEKKTFGDRKPPAGRSSERSTGRPSERGPAREKSFGGSGGKKKSSTGRPKGKPAAGRKPTGKKITGKKPGSSRPPKRR